MNEQHERRQRFRGYAGPNYTPVPDELFDEQLPDLSGAELKVLLYIIRRTFGFKRESDTISLSQMLNGLRTRDGRQLDRGVGLTKKTLLQAIKSLEEQNIILTERRRSQEKGDEPTSYRLNVRANSEREEIPPPVGEFLPHGRGGENPPRRWGNFYPTQETGRQETDFDHSNFESSHDQREITMHLHAAGPAFATNLTEPADRSAEARQDAPMPLGEILRLRAQGTASGDREPSPAVAAAPTNRPGHQRRGRPPGAPEEREQLAAYLGDFARELGDAAPLSSTITRVVTLFQSAQLPPAQWGDVLYQARRITQERTAQIRTLATEGEQRFRRKNKMPYFLAVLEDLLGLAEDGAPPPAAPSSRRQGGRGRGTPRSG